MGVPPSPHKHHSRTICPTKKVMTVCSSLGNVAMLPYWVGPRHHRLDSIRFGRKASTTQPNEAYSSRAGVVVNSLAQFNVPHRDPGGGSEEKERKSWTSGLGPGGKCSWDPADPRRREGEGLNKNEQANQNSSLGLSQPDEMLECWSDGSLGPRWSRTLLWSCGLKSIVRCFQ